MPKPIFEDPRLNKMIAKLNMAAPVGAGQVNNGTSLNLSGLTPNLSQHQKNLLGKNNLTVADAVTNPKLLDLLKQVASQDAEIKASGANPENTSHRHGWLSRTLDVISRPMYAMAEGSKQLAESVTSGDSIAHDFGAFGSGAVQGIEGKKKTDFIQVLQEAQDVRAAKKKGMNGADAVAYAKAHPGFSGSTGLVGVIGGLAMDVAGDPSTYLGVGIVPKIAKGAELVGGADKALQGISAADKLSPEARDLITGAALREGKFSSQLAKSQVVKVHGIAEKVAKAEGSASYDKALGEGLKNEHLAGTAEHLPVNDREIMILAKQAKNSREQEVMKNILDNYNKVASQSVTKHLALTLPGGIKATIPGIPSLDLIAATTKGGLSRIDPVARGMKTFSKNFQTVAHAFPELHDTKLQAFDLGMTRARLHGKEIRQVLNPLGKDGRTEAFLAAVAGHPSGHLVEVPLKGGGTEKIDAADWIKGRINPMQASVLEHGLTPEDFKPWLHASLPLKDKILVNGKKVHDPNWIANSMKDWNVPDGGKSLWLMESGFEQTMAYKSMLASMGDTFGAHIGEFASDAQKTLFDTLKKEHGWVAPEGIKELEHHVFPKETAAYITQISKLMKDEKNWSSWWRRWAKIQQPIKFMLTLPNPSFHIHNAIGDGFINQLDNVGPLSYMQSAKILKHRSSWFEGYNPAEGTFPLMTREGDPLSVARKVSGPDNKTFIKNTMNLQSADGKIHPYLSEAEIYAGYNKFGLRQNYATDLGFQDASPVGNLRGMVDKITSASEAREDYFRMAHFINRIKANPSKARTLEDAMTVASKRVRDTHFDYTDFTKFEKQVMSQLIPFYKWTRKALPLMAQVLMTQPGKAVLIPKALRTMAALTGNTDMTSNDTLPNLQGAIVPKWMMDSGYVPIAKSFMGSGNPAFGYVPNPFSDMINQQFNGINDGGSPNLQQFLLGSASPIIKDPTELLTNKSAFTGAHIINRDPGKPSIPNQLFDYFASQVPATNAAYQANRGNIGTLISLLSGVSVQPDTTVRQKGELLRRRDVGRAHLRKIRYQHGGTLPKGL